MKLNTLSRYAVRAMFDIAYYNNGAPTPVKDIAKRQNLTPRYLQQIFFRLKKARIVTTKTGPTGGYYLSKHPDKITIEEVIRAVEGPIAPVFCTGKGNTRDRCPREPHCITRKVWTGAAAVLKSYFQGITIGDLCRSAGKAKYYKVHPPNNINTPECLQ